ncbi:hypothetical protein LY76DRAFT_234201 [Colletotrichum caudatum]|nr:hypothetical protein LY76DRAFT_234201 [Colletotrichum caudatum]
MPPREVPPGIIPVADQPRIELYSNRHPFELLIGPDFVGEMNANVVMMMHQDPLVAADTISAMGYSYEVGNEPSALLVVLNRRAKILANLRNMKPSLCFWACAPWKRVLSCGSFMIALAWLDLP